MIIVGVRFRDVGKIYYYDPGDIELTQGVPVIVETMRGIEYGFVAFEAREIPDEELQELEVIRRVLRIATPADNLQEEGNRKREEEARIICLEKIKAHGLDMHLVDEELTFDLSKITFYYTADGRVDFRELVKDLAATFRMRIELRQIGVRDEAKMLNGIGICGRTLCCATFLDGFQPVSIKTAKDQGLSLNPAKISGICGKLMCCLKYEEETYTHLNQGMPGVGDLVRTPDGDGEVMFINVLRQTCRVAVRKNNQDAPTLTAYDVSTITILERRPRCEHECATCHACQR